MSITAPRRSMLNLNTKEEIQIYYVMLAIEKLPADPLLTDCVTLLGQAKNKLSDWVDANPNKQTASSVEEKSKHDFQLGDIVRLKSGGPSMVIGEIEKVGDKIGCTWFDNNHASVSPQTFYFSYYQLTKKW